MHQGKSENATSLPMRFRCKKLIPRLSPHKSQFRSPVSKSGTLPPIVAGGNFLLHRHLMCLILPRTRIVEFRSIPSIEMCIVVVHILVPRLPHRFELIGLLLDRFGYLLLPLLVEGSIVLFEILGNQFVVINNLLLVLVLLRLVLLEYFIDIFRVEFDVAPNPFNPSLVHLVEIPPHYLPNLELKYSNILIQVHLHDVGYKQEGKLHPFSLLVLLQLRCDIHRIVDVLVQAGVGYLPLHLLQSRPQEQCLQLVHHHYLHYFNQDFVDWYTVHVGFILSILAYLFEQVVSIVCELALYVSGELLLVSLPVGLLSGRSFSERCPDSLHVKHIIHVTSHISKQRINVSMYKLLLFDWSRQDGYEECMRQEIIQIQ